MSCVSKLQIIKPENLKNLWFTTTTKTFFQLFIYFLGKLTDENIAHPIININLSELRKFRHFSWLKVSPKAPKKFQSFCFRWLFFFSWWELQNCGKGKLWRYIGRNLMTGTQVNTIIKFFIWFIWRFVGFVKFCRSLMNFTKFNSGIH